MYLENFNFFTIVIFVILLITGIIYLYFLYKKQNNFLAGIFLFISFLLILINIFGIKTSINFGDNLLLGGKVLFVMDVSKSMNTIDITASSKQISRLNFSKNLIKNFILSNTNNSYSLAIFAGETMEILPFTNDESIFIKILNGLDNSNISKNGSELIGVFKTLTDYFSNDNYGSVVILTDGGDDKIEILQETVNQINSKRINIFIVGVGSEKGNYIPDGYDVWGSILYKTYNGQKVLSKLNNDNLQKISNKFNFKYFNIDDINDEDNLHKIINSNIEKNTIINDEKSYIYLTRFLILLSFIFFSLFLVFDNFIGKK